MVPWVLANFSCCPRSVEELSFFSPSVCNLSAAEQMSFTHWASPCYAAHGVISREPLLCAIFLSTVAWSCFAEWAGGFLWTISAGTANAYYLPIVDPATSRATDAAQRTFHQLSCRLLTQSSSTFSCQIVMHRLSPSHSMSISAFYMN